MTWRDYCPACARHVHCYVRSGRMVFHKAAGERCPGAGRLAAIRAPDPSGSRRAQGFVLGLLMSRWVGKPRRRDLDRLMIRYQVTPDQAADVAYRYLMLHFARLDMVEVHRLATTWARLGGAQRDAPDLAMGPVAPAVVDHPHLQALGTL